MVIGMIVQCTYNLDIYNLNFILSSKKKTILLIKPISKYMENILCIKCWLCREKNRMLAGAALTHVK